MTDTVIAAARALPHRAVSRSDGAPCASPADFCASLRNAKLRPTRQRMALGAIIFGSGHRHFSADDVYDEAEKAKIQISLATVYNCIRAFKDAGMLREVYFDGSRVIYDTNTSDHFHFVSELDGSVIDVPSITLDRASIPGLPSQMDVAEVQIVFRIRAKGQASDQRPSQPLLAEAVDGISASRNEREIC